MRSRRLYRNPCAFRSGRFLLRADRLREDEPEELRCNERTGERRKPEHEHMLPIVMLVVDVGPRKRLRAVFRCKMRNILVFSKHKMLV
jgi:hypothetical protein